MPLPHRAIVSTALGLAALLAASAGAWAEPRLISLSYQKRAGAEDCPDEATLRTRIALRLGADPFRADAPAQLDVSVGKSPGGLSASVTLKEKATGKSLGKRQLDSAATDCKELSAALELAITLAIDPLYQEKPEPTPPPPPPAPVLPPKPPPPPPGPDLLFDADVAFSLSLGEAPNVSPGLALAGHLRWDFLSFGLEARATIPINSGVSAVPGASMSANQVTGALLACGHYGFVAGCVVGTVGALWISGQNVPNARTDTLLASTLAARVQGEYPLTDSILVRAHLDFGANLLRTTASIGEVDVWTTPAVFGLLAVGAAWRF